MCEAIACFIVELIQAARADPKRASQARPRHAACCMSRVYTDGMTASAEGHTRPVLARPARASDRLYEEAATASIVTHDAQMLYKYTVYRAIRWCRQLE